MQDYLKKWSPLSIILNSFDRVFVEAGDPGVQEMKTIGVKPYKIIKFIEWIDQTKFYPVPKTNESPWQMFISAPALAPGSALNARVTIIESLN